MGFSPLEGLMMATRSGDLDPTVVLLLIESSGFSPAEVSWILNESSGMLGVSGETGDLKDLLASNTQDAALAISMFCYRIRKYIGAYLAVLGGADAIVFGGGIGEKAPAIRSRVLEHLEWAGIHIDAAGNDTVDPQRGGPIHRDDSAVEIWVTPVNENRLMAQVARSLLGHATEDDQGPCVGEKL